MDPPMGLRPMRDPKEKTRLAGTEPAPQKVGPGIKPLFLNSTVPFLGISTDHIPDEFTNNPFKPAMKYRRL